MWNVAGKQLINSCFWFPFFGEIDDKIYSHPSGRKNATYSHSVLANWVIICYRSHLLQEPETTIDLIQSYYSHYLLQICRFDAWFGATRIPLSVGLSLSHLTSDQLFPRLVGLVKGLYYPVILKGLFHKPWNKDPVIIRLTNSSIS